MPNMTFAPEEVKKSHPWQTSSREAFEAIREQKETMKRNFKLFQQEFVPVFIKSYNKMAEKENIPKLNSKWLQLKPELVAKSGGPREFYVKHRNQLEQKLFPGDPKVAKKAYDMFLEKLEKLPLIRVGPASPFLGHESGHVQTFWTDPQEVIKSRRESFTSPKPPMKTAINEAIASYRGFKIAWNAWKKWGIPKKAWGAWAGFPTYVRDFTPEEVKILFENLKKLENKAPGITNMAYKALYNYGDYVKPTLYNVPGKDWTEQEKIYLQRWLKERSGQYKEQVPGTYEERRQHLLKQPYVLKTDKTDKRYASLKKEAQEAKRTAQSLFKIFQFMFHRVPSDKRNEFFSKLKGKVIKLSPNEIGINDLKTNAPIGQAISFTKNLLSGLNPNFVKQVLIELIHMLSSQPIINK